MPTPAHEDGRAAFDLAQIRAQFPWFRAGPAEARAAYLDNAATTLRPRTVIAALTRAHEVELSTAHRGGHAFAARSTDAYEGARAHAARFVGATTDEIVFVRGTTEALNMIADCWARPRLGPADEVVVTELEHHSNWLPWQRVAEQTGARFRIVPVTSSGALDLDAVVASLSPATRIFACPHVSNVLGTELPLAALAACLRARSPAALFVVDGAQAAGHLPIDVGAVDCDFYAFSGHKLYGPSGIGVLFGRRAHWAGMPPYQVGGGMVGRVRDDGSRYLEPPARFEAGTPNVAGAIGLSAAFSYLERLDRAAARRHEVELADLAASELERLPGAKVLGREHEFRAPSSIVAFVVDGIHAHDLATVLDSEGVAVRAGHHCAQPLMRRLGCGTAARASFALYNRKEDVLALLAAVERACKVLL